MSSKLVAIQVARLHAFRFYSLIGALDSMVRVGQDLADDYIYEGKFESAKQVLAEDVLPTVLKAKMFDRILQVRSQFAVVLAYCREVDAAEAEIAKLEPYAPGFNDRQKSEIAMQKELIADLRRNPRMSLREFNLQMGLEDTQDLRRKAYPAVPQKIGRNESCPCGSGIKFKKCHGR